MLHFLVVAIPALVVSIASALRASTATRKIRRLEASEQRDKVYEIERELAKMLGSDSQSTGFDKQRKIMQMIVEVAKLKKLEELERS